VSKPNNGLVCVFCGESWEDDGIRSLQDLIKDAVSHEAKCELNPHLVEISRLKNALLRIRNFPVHSEPVGGAYAMQDIADEALKL